MAFGRAVLPLAAIISSLLALAECGFVFKLQFLSYSNPSGKEMDGDCCDTILDCGSLPCDHDITFCLDEYRNSPNDHRRNDLNSCSLYRQSTGRLDNRLVNYFRTGRIGAVTNPIVIKRSSWPGKFVLKVHIRDHDAWKLINKYSDVDKMFTTLEPPLSRGVAEAKWVRHSIRGIRFDSPTTLDYQMMAYCEKNFYGQKCDKFCFGQDHQVTGHFTCDPDTGDKICLTGWEQPETNCKVRADDCAGDPCVRGKCIDGYQQFTCQCPNGYTGYRCETDIDECASSPCDSENTVRCVSGNGTYRCFCKKGFAGMNCDLNLCQDDLGCLNGGTCVGDGECICPPGYTGDNCEIDLCDTISCRHGGKCSRGECICPKQYTGSRCELKANLCQGVSCPSGQCVDGLCVDPCKDKPCLNKATCFMKSDGTDYFCRCLPSYTGKNCESLIEPPYSRLPIDPACHNVTCHNGGSCQAGQCHCSPGFDGPTCDKAKDFCQGVLCQNGGTCFSNDRTYICVCAADYTGAKCERRRGAEADACQDVFCLNGGWCVDGSCQCRSGFAGSRCQILIGCSPNPCLNGGQCYSNAYAHTCVCPQSWTGPSCEHPITPPTKQAELKAEVTEAGNKYWVYIVIGVSLAFVVFLVIVVILLLLRSSRLKKRNRARDGSFENQAFREDKSYQNVTSTRERRMEYRRQTSVGDEAPPRVPPPRNGRPPWTERSVSYDGTSVQMSVPEASLPEASRPEASRPEASGTSAATGYAYAKMDRGGKGAKTRDVRTPKNLEEKFLAMKAAVDEEDLKA